MTPIAVCIPTLGMSGEMLLDLVRVCSTEPDVIHVGLYTASPETSIYQKWNQFAAQWSEHAHMAFLNDDIEMMPSTLPVLASALVGAMGMVSVAAVPNEPKINEHRHVRPVNGTYRQGGISGAAFVVRKGCWPTNGIDERFRVWNGDDDLVWKLRENGHGVAVHEGVTVRHVHSMTINALSWCAEQQGRDFALWRELGRP